MIFCNIIVDKFYLRDIWMPPACVLYSVFWCLITYSHLLFVTAWQTKVWSPVGPCIIVWGILLWCIWMSVCIICMWVSFFLYVCMSECMCLYAWVPKCLYVHGCLCVNASDYPCVYVFEYLCVDANWLLTYMPTRIDVCVPTYLPVVKTQHNLTQLNSKQL